MIVLTQSLRDLSSSLVWADRKGHFHMNNFWKTTGAVLGSQCSHQMCSGVLFWTSSDLVLCSMSISSGNTANVLLGRVFRFRLNIKERNSCALRPASDLQLHVLSRSDRETLLKALSYLNQNANITWWNWSSSSFCGPAVPAAAAPMPLQLRTCRNSKNRTSFHETDELLTVLGLW